MSNPLTDVLPAKVRRYFYAFYAALGISFGAVQVGYATAGVSQPTWLLVAFAVFGYLGTALGLVAASNTKPVSAASAAQIAQIEQIKAQIARLPKQFGDEFNNAARHGRRNT